MPLRVLLDTAVPAYALGGPHPMKRPCMDALAARAAGRVEFHASVEMVQELLFHRMRTASRTAALTEAHAVRGMCELHPFDSAILTRSMELIALHDSVRGRDAVHAATGLEHGMEAVLSPDRAFDAIPGLTRIDPTELATVLGRR